MIIQISTWENDTRSIKVVKTCHGLNHFYSVHTLTDENMITEAEAKKILIENSLNNVDTIKVEISISVTI
jgi:hypothetical protein